MERLVVETGDIDTFHTLVRRAITAMRREHLTLEDHTIVFKYLETLPRDKAKTLEDPVRRPPKGWTSEALMSAAKELFSIDKAYDGGEGGLPKAGKQRATWANDRKLAQTPLAAPPQGPPGSAKGGGGGSGERVFQGGVDHAQQLHRAQSHRRFGAL